MGFGNIGLLFGLVLGLVPIIIHLINRRRAKLRRFAAIEFLMLSDKRLARRLKLKQILILALRVALILALVFALAKPYLEPDTEPSTAQVNEPGVVALVIDDTASMQALDSNGRTLFDLALDKAQALINQAGPRTSFVLVTLSTPARLLTPAPSFDHAALTRTLKGLRPTAATADLTGALQEAGRVLSESGERQRSVVMLSDAATHTFPSPLTWSWVPLTVFEVPNLQAESARHQNLAVLDAQALDPGAPDANDKVKLEVRAKVANFGESPQSVKVHLEIGAATVAEALQLAPGEQRDLAFKLESSASTTQGQVRLEAEANNAFSLDDTFYFTVGARRALQTLIVNGAPSSTSYLDEAFFLRAALVSTVAGESPIQPTITSVAELTPARIQTADVVVLANVARLSREQVLALEQFVDNGGGLLITAGDQWVGDLTQIAALNQSYGKLLPLPIREVKPPTRTNDAKVALNAFTVETADFSHPIFQVFDGLEDASLFRSRILGHALVEDVATQSEAKILASFTGGTPALLERELGRGRILLLTTTIDRDWADIALRTSFPPLVQRMVGYLARTLEKSSAEGFVVGSDIRARAPEGNAPLLLRGPDGTETPLDAGIESTQVYLGALTEPGHWLVMRAGERERGLPFALNVSRQESQLGLAPETTLTSWRDALTRDNGVLPGVNLADSPDEIPEGAGRTSLWPFILAGLFLLFGSEAYLLVRNA